MSKSLDGTTSLPSLNFLDLFLIFQRNVQLQLQTPSCYTPTAVIKHLRRNLSSHHHHHTHNSVPNFGILFDIDGVIVRGRRVLPFAPEAFTKLVDQKTGKFRVPAVFLTNAGNSLRQEKADKLSDWLNVEITEDQVVMAHSPLKMFTEYHKKHVLVTGQGPVELIARSLGFNNITTIDQLRHAFPNLDSVDHKRRRAAPCAFEKYYPRIEAVVLFGEPVRWETSLQVNLINLEILYNLDYLEI